MQISALLTSAGINIGVCVLLFSLYSILRKQPSNASVYFGRQLASGRGRPDDPFCMDRFVPSTSWILKAWQTTEEEILAVGGMDAVVFLRIVVFSLRVFSLAAVICMFVLLPMNYYGQEMQHKQIPSEELEVFTIANVKEGSTWLGAHCIALYVISCSACVLLYFEYKSITKMRLAHITNSPANPSHFTVLVRSIPWSPKESYGDMVKKFFTNYYASSYLSHQMVYRSGTYHKLMDDAEQMCQRLKSSVQPGCNLKIVSCGLCGDNTNSFKKLTQEGDSVNSVSSVKSERHLTALESVRRKKECAAAFVFFKTRYAADVAADVLQSSNPMLWVTELAPEPHDILWSNLGIPYRQLWIRKIATLIAAIVFMFVFLIPVAFIQGMTQLEQLSEAFPFLKGILEKPLMNQLVTGYLPSVILMTFLYAVPPTMMLFSVLEGPVSRSGRKKSACLKVLFFTIWNVFFVNILSGSVIRQLSIFSSVRDIPQQLAKAVPTQASFFMTYVLSSGWAGLACELMQLFPLTCNLLRKFIFRMEDEPTYVSFSFPYHTEVPRILLFGLLGFTCSIMAPLIVPLLLIYFFLAYLIYRNQILNVYFSKYESGGQFWPIAHNTTIFSLVLTQIIALGVFGMKQSPVASGFTVPLIIFTLLFSEYCRQRFFPIFKKNAAQVLMEMDRQDEQSGRLQEIYNQLYTAYSRYPMASPSIIIPDNRDCPVSCPDPESLKQGLIKGKEIINEENEYPIIDLK